FGDLYYKDGNWATAIALYKDALDGWKKFGRVPDTIETLDHQATCYWKSGDSARAGDTFTKALAACDQAQLVRGLQRRKYLFDVIAALLSEHYSTMLGALGRRQDAQDQQIKAEHIWQALANKLNLPAAEAKDKGKLIEELAAYYCRTGMQAEANKLYDILFD